MAKTITKTKARGKDRWRVRVYMGIDPRTGKQQWAGKTHPTHKEAEKEENELKRQKGTGVRIAAGKQPFKDYMVGWLAMRKRTGIKRGKHAGKPLAPGTLEDYRQLLDRFIFNPPQEAPPLGQRPLSRLQAEDFGDFYQHFEDQGNGITVLQYLHSILRQALKDAVNEDRILSRNPTDSRRAQPQARASQGEGGSVLRAMSKEEADRFLQAAQKDRYVALWLVLLTTGIRPGEALALRWQDVDLEEGRIQVLHSLTRRGVEGWQLKAPKTDKARRSIPLSGGTLQALREHRKKQAEERLRLGAEYEDKDFIFATSLGRPLDSTNLLSKNFKRICEKAGLGAWGERPPKPSRGPQGKAPFKPAFRMYDLRHTCATLLLRAGVSPKIVSERLGHASSSFTLDVYGHVLPDMQDQAKDAMEEMFG